MKPIRSFDQVIAGLQGTGKRARIAVVHPDDEQTQYAVNRALQEGIAEFVLVGDPGVADRCPALAPRDGAVRWVDVRDEDEAARQAVRMARTGEVDTLMKGLVNTDKLLHAILNKQEGLLPRGRVLTHLAMMELPSMGRLLFLTDAAVIPRPTLTQRLAMLDYAVQTCRGFGIERPRIALIHCIEKVSDLFPYSHDYVEMVRMARAGELGDVIVDGPMDVKTALDRHGAAVKGIASPIDGQADVLLFPNIESGNVFYKVMSLFTPARLAGLLQGPTCPVIVSSRADSGPDKYYSLVMACQSIAARRP